VSAGWSLLSSAIGFQASTTFGDSATFISAWKWADDGVGGKTWAVYLADGDGGATYAASKGFLALTTIASGEGLWVNSKTAKTVSVTGQPQYGELAFGPGWNRVGLKAQGKTQVTDLAQAHPGLISVWKWVDGKWAVNLPGQDDSGAGYAGGKGFFHLTEISPGEGFWVNQ
jgi:hypothetical protein